MSKNTNLSFLTDYITADITNGRIGINNASPTVAFDVSGATRISGALTLTSTISNGTYTYTLPSATGTLALTSALSSYLPLTGGTLTGALGGTSATFSSTVTVGGNLGSSSDYTALTVRNQANGDYYVGIDFASGTDNGTSSIRSYRTNSAVNYETALTFWTKSTGANPTIPTEKMRITSAGNVGIGTTNPDFGSFGAAEKILGISNTSERARVQFQNTSTGTTGVAGTLAFFNGSTQLASLDIIADGATNSGRYQFNTNNGGSFGERMRITSGGNVLIGGTSTLGASGTNLEISGGRAQLVVNSTTATASWFSVYPAGDGNTYILRNTGYSYLFGTATNQTTTGFVQQMSISSNGSIGAPSGTNIYNASDARLKKNISTTTYGLNTISALNPVKFNWVDGFEPSEDGKDMLGFVAQEVQTVLPEAIESFGANSITVGDTIIDNPLRVNEKFLIPVLVKAIQELRAEIEKLKQK